MFEADGGEPTEDVIVAFPPEFVWAFLEHRGITRDHPSFSECERDVWVGLSRYWDSKTSKRMAPERSHPPLNGAGTPTAILARKKALAQAQAEFGRPPEGQWTEALLFEWADAFVDAVHESAKGDTEPVFIAADETTTRDTEPGEEAPQQPSGPAACPPRPHFPRRAAWFIREMKKRQLIDKTSGLDPKTCQRIRAGLLVSTKTLLTVAAILRVDPLSIPND